MRKVKHRAGNTCPVSYGKGGIMLISLSEYKNSLDKVENELLSKAETELTKEELAKQIRTLLERAAATGVHLANREVKKLESRNIKKFSERVSQSFKWDITDEEIKAGKGIIDRAGEFWDEYSLKIAGDWEQDKLDKTAQIMQNISKEEYTQKELQNKISEELGMWNARRVEMIARTETTKMFNYGRLETFRENAKNGGVTKAVKFSSILDERVTEICRSRHGLILSLDDPRIDDNTPPLHINCRSILLPVPAWEFDEEHNNKSSDKWGEVEKVDETWGNPFAYGGRELKTNTVQEKFMEVEYDKQQDKMLKAEKEAVLTYSTSKFAKINETIRAVDGDINKIKNEQLKETAKEIDSAINKFELQYKTIVYRGLGEVKNIEDWRKGDVITEKSFTSTSIRKQKGEDFAEFGEDKEKRVVIRLTVPAKNKAVVLKYEDLSEYDEYEVLLPIKTKYKINKIEKQEGYTYIEAEVFKNEK